jgi:hypothetical protein
LELPGSEFGAPGAEMTACANADEWREDSPLATSTTSAARITAIVELVFSIELCRDFLMTILIPLVPRHGQSAWI